MPAVAELLAEAGRRAGRDRPGGLRRRAGQLHQSADRRRDREGDGARGGLSARSGLVARAPRRIARAVRAGRYLAALDALRGEHYVGLFEVTRCAGGPRARAGAADPVRRGRGARRSRRTPRRSAPGAGGARHDAARRRGRAARRDARVRAAADLATWEPAYGRLAEAQVKWEAAHGRALEAVVTATVGALQIRPAVDARRRGDGRDRARVVLRPVDARRDRVDASLRSHARAGRRRARRSRRGWRGQTAGVCCRDDRRARGGDRRPRRGPERSAAWDRACADRPADGRAGGSGVLAVFLEVRESNAPPARCTSRADSRASAAGGGTTGIRRRMRSCSSGSWVRPEVKCHVK